MFSNKMRFTGAGGLEIGDPYGGGFYAGLHRIDNIVYRLIVSPIEAQVDEIAWKTTTANTPGTSSRSDGLSNTQAMIAASAANHPAARHCAQGSWGGRNDWFLGALTEWQVIYVNLKPDSTNNDTSYGKNLNAVPPRLDNYQRNNPGQTDVEWFQAPNGDQNFLAGFMWTSTQGSDVKRGVCHHPTNGMFHGITKTSNATDRPVRPIRREFAYFTTDIP